MATKITKNNNAFPFFKWGVLKPKTISIGQTNSASTARIIVGAALIPNKITEFKIATDHFLELGHTMGK